VYSFHVLFIKEHYPA